MRSALLFIAAAAVVVAAGAAWMSRAGVSTSRSPDPALPGEVRLKVEGMTCGGCAAAVSVAAKRVSGVLDAEVDLDHGIARIVYDPARTQPELIAAAITEQTGFRARALASAYNQR